MRLSYVGHRRQVDRGQRYCKGYTSRVRRDRADAGSADLDARPQGLDNPCSFRTCVGRNLPGLERYYVRPPRIALRQIDPLLRLPHISHAPHLLPMRRGHGHVFASKRRD